MGQKCGVKFKWSCDNCSLLISKVNGFSGISMKELPEAKKQCVARHGKILGSRLSKQPYLKGKSDSKSKLKKMGTQIAGS